MQGPNIGQIAIWFAVFLLSLTVHECAHAWMAERSGDSTGRYLGRVTLNPLPHIDILGTVILPLSMMVLGTGMMFGWAKPVPFNPTNLRDRKVGEIMIALAGPFSNIALAIIFFVSLKLLASGTLVSVGSLGDMADPIGMMLNIGLQTNIVLAVFNLIPIPPLDGHHVLRNLLPDTLAQSFAEASPMLGLIGMVVLLSTGFAGYLINPVLNMVYSWLP